MQSMESYILKKKIRGSVSIHMTRNNDRYRHRISPRLLKFFHRLRFQHSMACKAQLCGNYAINFQLGFFSTVVFVSFEVNIKEQENAGIRKRICNSKSCLWVCLLQSIHTYTYTFMGCACVQHFFLLVSFPLLLFSHKWTKDVGCHCCGSPCDFFYLTPAPSSSQCTPAPSSVPPVLD